MTTSLLNRVPVIPVVVIDDLERAVPIARALVAGGLPVIELTLRTPVALDRHRADRRRSTRDLPRRGHHRRPRPGQAGSAAGAQFLVSPGSTPDSAEGNDRHRTPAPARGGNGVGDPDRPRGRIHRAEVLPGRGRRRGELPQVGQFTDPGGAVLPDRRHLHHQRRPVSGLAEVVRRRLLDHTVQCCRSPGLGVRHRPGCWRGVTLGSCWPPSVRPSGRSGRRRRSIRPRPTAGCRSRMWMRPMPGTGSRRRSRRAWPSASTRSCPRRRRTSRDRT